MEDKYFSKKKSSRSEIDNKKQIGIKVNSDYNQKRPSYKQKLNVNHAKMINTVT